MVFRKMSIFKTIFLLAVAIGIVYLSELQGLSSLQLGLIDFVQYYSAANLWWNGSNPYNPDILFQIEVQFYPSLEEVIRMWNPPFIFPMIGLFLSLPFHYAATIWFCSSIVILLFTAAKCLQDFSDSPRQLLYLGALVVLLFVPTYGCLQLGQITPLFLAGVLMYLQSYRSPSSKYGEIYAGFGLTLTLVKPHLFLLLYLFEFVRSYHRKKWQIILTFVSLTLLLCTISTAILPEVWSYYREALKAPPLYFHSASLGSWLQYFFNSQSTLNQFLPTLIGLFFGVIWLLSRSSQELNSLPFAMLIITLSVALSPYSWPFDFCVLLPCYVWILVQAKQNRNLTIKIAAGFLVLSNVVALALVKKMQFFFWFPWLTFIILGWCYYQVKSAHTGTPET
ncbi:DUF2029 domain-containing protein [bacterium]|nr:DUF2029 domain-containing protein [bacterium]